MKKFYCLFIMLALCACSARTQTASTTIRLFPGEAPGETKELTETKEIVKENVGSTTLLSNVSTPEITIYPAPGSGLHPAVVVCPGGGYNILAYDKEGTEVCEWLNGNGITAVLLKYRVPRREGRPKHEAPLQDAQRALSYVRAHAAQLDIKSNQIPHAPIRPSTRPTKPAAGLISVCWSTLPTLTEKTSSLPRKSK